MRTITYKKLVRDRIPEIITKKGGQPTVRRVPRAQLAGALRKKLGEEVIELQKAKKKEDVIMEIADIMEVLDALCAESDIDVKDVARVQREKRKERGGFEEGFFLVSVKE